MWLRGEKAQSSSPSTEKSEKKEVLITQHLNGSSKTFSPFLINLELMKSFLCSGLAGTWQLFDVGCQLWAMSRHSESHLLNCHVGSAFEVNLLVIGFLLRFKINVAVVPENVIVMPTWKFHKSFKSPELIFLSVWNENGKGRSGRRDL